MFGPIRGRERERERETSLLKFCDLRSHVVGLFTFVHHYQPTYLLLLILLLRSGQEHRRTHLHLDGYMYLDREKD